MRIAAICNTPLQILILLQIKNKFFPNDDLHLMISDHINNGGSIVENAKKTDMFDNISYVETFEYCRGLGEYANMSNHIRYSDRIIKKNNLDLSNKIDILFVNNIDPFADRVYEKCKKRNKNLRLCLFEDGNSTYCVMGESIKNIINHEKRIKTKVRNVLFGVKRTAVSFDELFLFYPDRIHWKCNCNITQIPLLNREDKKYIDDLNRLFNYDSAKHEYSTKYIFFEESFFKEGETSLEPLFTDIVSGIVGIENITVKRHPRVDIDRFAAKGYKVNKNTAIPWELICLNDEKLEGRVLISISSGSVSNPITMCNIPVKSIVLKNLFNKDNNGKNKIYYDWLDEEIYLKYLDNIACPDTINELIDILKNVTTKIKRKKTLK